MPRKLREIPWLQTRDGTYYVHWYDKGAARTKRISLATADAVEAQERFAAFLTKGHSLFRSDGTQGLTVVDALGDYWREHVLQHVVAKKRQHYAIEHLKAWFKTALLVDVDIPASRAYADARRTGLIGGGIRRTDPRGSEGTIRRELVVLQAAANHAARWRRIGPAAMPPTAMPSIELPRETPREAAWLTREEFQRALEKAAGALKDFMAVAYYTGGRRASVEALTPFQIDLKAGRINLRSPTEDANQRRSVKRRPVVPIDPKLRAVLERLIETSGGDRLLPGDMYGAFRKHMLELGLVGKSHPHVLRHSRATHLLQDGVSIYDVARLLGDTVQTVERVYGHHSAEYLADVIGRVR